MNHLRCYEVLGLLPGATPEQIHRAYKRLAMEHHPDRSSRGSESHRLFCTVTEAYGQLKNAAALQSRLGSVGLCPKCERVAELFAGMDSRHYCASCLLYRRRRYLPPPTFQKVRCLTAVAMQGMALYCIVVSEMSGHWLPGAASALFALAAMAALAVNFLTADVIEA